MTKNLQILALMLASACTMSLTSCKETMDNILEDVMKYKVDYYLHNESGQDVTVFFSPRDGEAEGYTYKVKKGQVMEISQDAHWCVGVRYREQDSVVFVFADGKRVVHTYTDKAYGQDTHDFVYEPETNNIFYTGDGYGIPAEKDSWVRKQLSTTRHRSDYTIR